MTGQGGDGPAELTPERALAAAVLAHHWNNPGEPMPLVSREDRLEEQLATERHAHAAQVRALSQRIAELEQALREARGGTEATR
jgi:hypothetical protein